MDNKLQSNNLNDVVIKQLNEIVKNLKSAKSCIWDDTCAYTGINKSIAIAETLKDILE